MSLAAVPFFAGLDDDALERVAAGMRSRRFRRGEVIFHVGDPGDALFIIVSGEVKIGLPSEAGDEAILVRLQPGDVFGELALLDGAPRSATATALSAAETVVLPRDRFRELIANEPAVRDALLASLALELRRLTTHVEELHFLDITGRLAACLVRLASDGGHDAPRRRDPPADVADAGRPGLDGRQHPPEREQAARAVRRRTASCASSATRSSIIDLAGLTRASRR